MKERWFLFYDGACPLCFRTQSKLPRILFNVKLATIDLNSNIAKDKGYYQVVLETPTKNYFGKDAWLKILTQTKYNWITWLFFRPLFLLGYMIINKNRKLIGKWL